MLLVFCRRCQDRSSVSKFTLRTSTSEIKKGEWERERARKKEGKREMKRRGELQIRRRSQCLQVSDEKPQRSHFLDTVTLPPPSPRSPAHVGEALREDQVVNTNWVCSPGPSSFPDSSSQPASEAAMVTWPPDSAAALRLFMKQCFSLMTPAS